MFHRFYFLAILCLDGCYSWLKCITSVFLELRWNPTSLPQVLLMPAFLEFDVSPLWWCQCRPQSLCRLWLCGRHWHHHRGDTSNSRNAGISRTWGSEVGFHLNSKKTEAVTNNCSALTKNIPYRDLRLKLKSQANFNEFSFKITSTSTCNFRKDDFVYT